MYIWNTSIPFRLPHRLILAQPGAPPGTRWSQNIASLTSTPGIVTLNGLVKKKRIKSSLRHFFLHKLGPSKVSINLDVCRLEYFVIRPSMSTWELRNITTDIFWQTCYIARTFTLNFLKVINFTNIFQPILHSFGINSRGSIFQYFKILAFSKYFIVG